MIDKSEVVNKIKGIPYFKRKVKCPRHYILNPKEDPFIRELHPLMKNVSKYVVDRYKVKKYRIKRDRYNNPMINWKAYYQPAMSASFFIEHVWDPHNHICRQCRYRCMEGKQRINENSIRRLHGGTRQTANVTGRVTLK